MSGEHIGPCPSCGDRLDSLGWSLPSTAVPVAVLTHGNGRLAGIVYRYSDGPGFGYRVRNGGGANLRAFGDDYAKVAECVAERCGSAVRIKLL